MLRERTLDAMLTVALHPLRASSYNNVLADATGGVVNVEGSATSAELTGPNERGHLVHTNHYRLRLDARLRGRPGVRGDLRGADAASGRAPRATLPASITMETLRGFLSDHENAPDSLCRHPHPGPHDSITCFWCVADVTDGVIRYGRGNPCDSTQQEFLFADYVLA